MDEYTSPSKLPVALAVCSESRTEALKHYERTFATNLSEAMVYFDYDIDTLYIGMGNMDPSDDFPEAYLFNTLKAKDVSRIRNIATDEEPGWFVPREPDNTSNVFLDHLTGVKTLTFIAAADQAFDVVLHQSESDTTELQAWKISDNGTAALYDLTTAEARTDEKSSNIVFFKESIEHSNTDDSTSISAVRIVSRSILAREPQLTKRMTILNSLVYNPDIGCLYTSDGFVDWLMSLKKQALEGDPGAAAMWHHYSSHCSRGLTRVWDPAFIYACQYSCACPGPHGHNSMGAIWSEPGVDFRRVNLRSGNWI